MARNPLTKPILVLLLLSIVLYGCSGGKPAVTPTADVSKPAQASSGAGGSAMLWKPQVDMRPVVKDFLANVPEAWGLMPAQGVIPGRTILVDVREPEEYAKGFIQGAINIPLRELTKSLAALPPQDKEVVMVCDSGTRGALAMVALQMLGWKQAKSLYNGLNGWQEAKLPLVTSPVPKRPANPQPKVDAGVLASLDSYLNVRLDGDYGRMSPDGLAAAMDETPFEELVDPEVWAQGPPFLIDVSEPNEFAKGSIDAAINMPFRTIPDSLDRIPWSTPTIVVCGIESQMTELNRTHKRIVTICPNGHRSAVAMMVFHLLGFRDVKALDGGIKAWKAAGNP